MKYLLTLGSIACLIVAIQAAAAHTEISAYNEDVTRKINLEPTSVVEIQTDIKFKPEGSEKKVHYYFAIPRSLEDKLVSLTASSATSQAELKVEKATTLPNNLKNLIGEHNATDIVLFQITIEDEAIQGFVVFTVKETYKRRKDPFPSKIQIREDQFLKFLDSKYYLSVYSTVSQKMQITYNTAQTIFYTPDATAEKKSKFLKYGPFKDIKPLSYEEMMIHYKHNAPLIIFTEVKKTIEVSHWGNILVDEYYDMWNEAAGIKGEFGRVDYQHWDTQVAQYAVKSLETKLPRYIRGLYYWDYIGNISTSNAYRGQDEVTFRIEPRFPVFGQWKVDWSQGYSMPTRYHLFKNTEGKYFFNYTFDFDYHTILAENYTLKIILPEGSKNIKVHLPVGVDSLENGLYFSTLDYIGRPEITIKKSNVLSTLHNQAFQVSYDFPTDSLFIEPLYVIAFFFACYLAAIVYSRIDLRFKDEKKIHNL